MAFNIEKDYALKIALIYTNTQNHKDGKASPI